MKKLYDKIKKNVSPKKKKKLKNMIIELENYNLPRVSYRTNFNEISYNNKEIVQSTLSKKLIIYNKSNKSDNILLNNSKIKNKNFNYSINYDSDSSKDSFYYLTSESDSD